jgi:hypothetical protein
LIVAVLYTVYTGNRRFDVLTVVKMSVLIFWVVMPLQIYLQVHIVLQPKRAATTYTGNMGTAKIQVDQLMKQAYPLLTKIINSYGYWDVICKDCLKPAAYQGSKKHEA